MTDFSDPSGRPPAGADEQGGEADGSVVATAELSIVADPEARRSPRRIVNIAAALRDEEAESMPALVLDLSDEGCRIETAAALAPGTHILLKMPGIEARRAAVRWARNGQAGCEFAVPLYPAEIDLMFAIQKKRARPKDVFARR